MPNTESRLSGLTRIEGRREVNSTVEQFLNLFDSFIDFGRGLKDKAGKRMTTAEVADMRAWADKTMQSVIGANADETMGYLSALENDRQEVPAVDALIGGMTPDRNLRDEFRNTLIDIIKTLSKNRIQ